MADKEYDTPEDAWWRKLPGINRLPGIRRKETEAPLEGVAGQILGANLDRRVIITTPLKMAVTSQIPIGSAASISIAPVTETAAAAVAAVAATAPEAVAEIVAAPLNVAAIVVNSAGELHTLWEKSFGDDDGYSEVVPSEQNEHYQRLKKAFHSSLPLNEEGEIDVTALGEMRELIRKINNANPIFNGTFGDLQISQVNDEHLREVARIYVRSYEEDYELEEGEMPPEERTYLQIKETLAALKEFAQLTEEQCNFTFKELPALLNGKVNETLNNVLAHTELMPSDLDSRRSLYWELGRMINNFKEYAPEFVSESAKKQIIADQGEIEERISIERKQRHTLTEEQKKNVGDGIPCKVTYATPEEIKAIWDDAVYDSPVPPNIQRLMLSRARQPSGNDWSTPFLKSWRMKAWLPTCPMD